MNSISLQEYLRTPGPISPSREISFPERPFLPASREEINQIYQDQFHNRVSKLETFTTGGSHQVYDVELESGHKSVLRTTRTERGVCFEGAQYWEKILSPLGVPLPAIMLVDTSCAKYRFPFMIIERCPGTDLINVYGKLQEKQKKSSQKRSVPFNT